MAQAEDSLPDDLLAAMDAAADLQSDVEQLDADVAQLDVAALKQSFVDLTRLGNSEQQGPGAKADAQRWKEVFGSDTAWSKCSAAAATRPPVRSRARTACSGLPSNAKRKAAATAWPLRGEVRAPPCGLCVPDVPFYLCRLLLISLCLLWPSRRHAGHRTGCGAAELRRRGGRVRI